MVTIVIVFVSLFPAWAGVILKYVGAGRELLTFPRMGGGDPDMAFVPTYSTNFSPHGRG